MRTQNGMPIPQKSDILFLGEAPGRSEDAIGKPFIGPAGVRFDMIVAEAMERIGTQLSWVVTNTVACAPYDDSGDIGKPKQSHLKACMPRVIEMLNMLQPKCVVLMGNEAEKGWNLIHTASFRRKYEFESVQSVKIAHPSWIEFYSPDPDLEHKRAVLTISDFLTRHVIH